MKQLVLVFCLLFSFFTYSQNSGVIEGTVVDSSEENAPILFAKVTVKETKQSITTGFRGGYFFKDLKPGIYTLVFNFLGYEPVTKQVEVKENKKVLDISLRPSTDINFEAIELTSK